MGILFFVFISDFSVFDYLLIKSCYPLLVSSNSIHSNLSPQYRPEPISVKTLTFGLTFSYSSPTPSRLILAEKDHSTTLSSITTHPPLVSLASSTPPSYLSEFVHN